MNKKNTKYFILGLVILIGIGIVQIYSHFTRVQANPDEISLKLNIINSVIIPLFIIFIYFFVRGASDKKNLSFTFGIIFIFIMGLLIVTSHYIQNMYYSDNLETFKIFGISFEAHFIVDLVIYAIIGVFIILIYLYIHSRRY